MHIVNITLEARDAQKALVELITAINEAEISGEPTNHIFLLKEALRDALNE
jgi:hypothetical protein